MMNNNLFDHIEFLLSTHNCVVVPGFGGFVLNQCKSSSDGSVWQVPKYVVSFNAELNHDDGLLSTFVSLHEECSYNLALRKIKDVVRNLKRQIQLEGVVRCGRLGELSLDEYNKTLFAANPNYQNAKIYGLPVLSIRRLDEIDFIKGAEKRYFSIGNIIGTVAATAATLILVVLPVSSVNDSEVVNVQQAGFAKAITQSNADILQQQNVSQYTSYVILGGEDTREKAELKLNELSKDISLPMTIVESEDNRFRIAVASFFNEPDAEDYLLDFKKMNPEFKNAWVYSSASLD